MKYVVIGVSLLLASGCGNQQSRQTDLPDSVPPVSGKVTLDEKPLKGATVLFNSADSSAPGAVGVTDAEGRYELSVGYSGGESKKGAIPGEYLVTVSLFVSPDGSPAPPPGPDEGPMMSGAMESLPLRYWNVEETPLKATVGPDGGTDFNFDLTSE
jgi:hypothetical protein